MIEKNKSISTLFQNSFLYLNVLNFKNNIYDIFELNSVISFLTILFTGFGVADLASQLNGIHPSMQNPKKSEKIAYNSF